MAKPLQSITANDWEAKEFAEIIGREHALAIDISQTYFSLAELAAKVNLEQCARLEWKSLRESGKPIQVLHEWVLEKQSGTFQDDYVMCDGSLHYIVQEEMVLGNILLILLFDCREKQLKLFLFRKLA